MLQVPWHFVAGNIFPPKHSMDGKGLYMDGQFTIWRYVGQYTLHWVYGFNTLATQMINMIGQLMYGRPYYHWLVIKVLDLAF